MFLIKDVTFTDGQTVNNLQTLVAIGPNNGGKSRLLREIVGAITDPAVPRLVVGSTTVDLDLVKESVTRMTSRAGSVDESGNYAFDVLNGDLSSTMQLRPNKSYVDTQINSGDSGLQSIFSMLGQHFALNLTTEQRLTITKRRANTNENFRGVQSIMHAAFEADGDVIDRINYEVRATFDRELVVDKSEFAVSQFRIKAAGASADATSRDQMRILELLDDQGDGIRAFSSICACALLLPRPVLAIDEPEAFLHPPQAYAIGRALIRLKDASRQLIVATHSAEVLRGLLSETTNLTIVRCSQSATGFLRRRLDPAELQKIADDAVLSSERVLDGLFYEGVIIVESDGDAILYRRVLEHLGYDGVFHFVNSYSKLAAAKVAVPYIATGVPFAIIVDFDVLRVPAELRTLIERLGVEWAEIQSIHSALVAEIEANDTPEDRVEEIKTSLGDVQGVLESDDEARAKLQQVRSKLSAVRDKASIWSDLKRQGRDGLSHNGQELFDQLNALLRPAGVFVVVVGEREAWLGEEVPYTKNKNGWTVNALAALANPLNEGHPLRNYMGDIVAHLRA